MSENNGPDDPGGRTALVVVGAVLIVLGLVNVGDTLGASRIFQPILSSFSIMRDWLLALGAVAAGVLIIVFASRGGTTFRMPSRADRLYRSREDKVVSGVAGGLAAYFGMDPTIVRLAIVALALFTDAWPVIVIYIAASIIVPEEPKAS